MKKIIYYKSANKYVDKRDKKISITLNDIAQLYFNLRPFNVTAYPGGLDVTELTTLRALNPKYKNHPKRYLPKGKNE